MALINEKSMDFNGMEVECAQLTATTSLTAPTVTASTSLVVGAETLVAADLTLLNGITATAAELNYNDVTTLGTVQASKTVTADANLDTTGFRNVGLSGALTFSAGGTFVSDNGTATSTAAAATINKMSGVITTEALTTAANADYTFTLTNSLITANSNLIVSVGYGTATTGHPNIRKVTPGAGSATIVIHNDDVAVALNGTIIIQFFLVKP